MEEHKNNRDRVKEITSGIEESIRDLFQSERYLSYLKTMSHFHRYSVNNTILIHQQRPDATLVAGYSKWKNQFKRHVKKGEKGIQILSPTPYLKKIEEIKRDPQTNAPLLDENGKVITEEREVKIPFFKVVSVFDVAQTEGKPLPTLSATLTGAVRQYSLFMEALKRSSPVPMDLRPLPENLDGFFNLKDQKITLREGMSEVQTVCAAIHEMTHAKLHSNPEERTDRETREVEAESVSYAVCAYYGIETGENSLGYIASWSKDRELKELRNSLEVITHTASDLISDIDHHFAALCKEHGLSFEDKEKQFLEQEGDAFAIYQLREDADRATLQFMGMDWLEKNHLPVERENYEAVYTGKLPSKEDIIPTLDRLYETFNRNRPDDFTGHSLSVSDMIAIKQDGVVSCHYVDNFGFREIPNFLKNAEMCLEDDYDMIDGIINNGPKEPKAAELEKRVKEEKKPSVRQKLKTLPSQEKKAPSKHTEMER